MDPTQLLKLDVLAHASRSTFGEFLVQQGAISRFQLFRALQMQDRSPGALLGQCAVALGYVPRHEIEQLHGRFERLHPDAAVELIATDAFERIHDVEVVHALP